MLGMDASVLAADKQEQKGISGTDASVLAVDKQERKGISGTDVSVYNNE